MKHKLIEVTENSNIEIGEESVELLLHTHCRSIECEDFRANNCRMKQFISALDGTKWQYSQTWVTPSKFLLHLVKTGGCSADDAIEMFNRIKNRWECIGSEDACSCDFLDEMKRLKEALEKDPE